MGNKEKRRHRSRSVSRERRTESSYERKMHRTHDKPKSSSHSRKKYDSKDSSSESNSRSPSTDRNCMPNSEDPDQVASESTQFAKYESTESSSESDSRSPSRERKKKKKHRNRSRSSDRRHKKSRRRDSSNSDDDSPRHKSRKSRRPTEEEMALLKEEAKRRKEILKATEGPEEKRARRLAKKEAKERKRKEKMGWDQEYMGYTNADNPFGDERLLDTFVWSKKMEKDGIEHNDTDEIHNLQKKKMEENRRELEKVKKRRLERERELEEREREREQLQRDKEAEYFREWEKQEDSFHLQQAKLRSEIRIQDGRAKPIDLLAKYISAEDDELAVEMHEPYTYLYGLTITDLEDLLEDIKVYLELEQGKNTEYWRDIVTVTTDELTKLKKLESTSKDFRDRREGINQSVTDEVTSVFKGKTTSQLLLLEDQIKKKLAGGEGVDVGYWESLIQQLKAHMAKTRLRERHQEVLRQKLFKLKQEQGIESEPLFPSGIPRAGTPRENSREATPDRRNITKTETPEDRVKVEEPQQGTSSEGVETGDKSEENDSDDDGDDAILTEADLVEEEQSVIDYNTGGYSPRLVSQDDLEIDTVIYDPEDDMKKLELARVQVRSFGKVRLDGEAVFIEKAKEGMNDDEAQFSVEFPLDTQAFMWSDKYRPRKPRFFNRVHTGFEWNKYNQTHYDIDNPPPKIVQGYKFNIFYPDLIEKTQTPEYTVTPIEDNQDFAILRFHAGPPYEDIAFKVVNKEWEHSYKRGFRCQFANNIMQLWFHFKRYRYRR